MDKKISHFKVDKSISVQVDTGEGAIDDTFEVIPDFYWVFNFQRTD